MPDEETAPADVLRAAYGAFVAAVAAVGDEESWLPTGCAGWAVRDLVLHCLEDARRGLVALHTPAHGQSDRDAVTYWRGPPGGGGDPADSRRFTRVVAGVFRRFDTLRELYAETAAAVVHAGAGTAADRCVATQGHVLSAGDLMRTLAVEATIHHLDLVVSLRALPGPSEEGLAEVRRTLDGLLGRPVPVLWDDADYARAATGRRPLTGAERARLGADGARFPAVHVAPGSGPDPGAVATQAPERARSGASAANAWRTAVESALVGVPRAVRTPTCALSVRGGQARGRSATIKGLVRAARLAQRHARPVVLFTQPLGVPPANGGQALGEIPAGPGPARPCAPCFPRWLSCARSPPARRDPPRPPNHHASYDETTAWQQYAQIHAARLLEPGDGRAGPGVPSAVQRHERRRPVICGPAGRRGAGVHDVDLRGLAARRAPGRADANASPRRTSP